MKISIFYIGDFPEGSIGAPRVKLYAKGLKERGYEIEVLLLHAAYINGERINTQVEGNFEGIYFKFLNGNPNRPDVIIFKVFDTLKGMWGAVKYMIKNRKKIALVFLYFPNILKVFPIVLIAKYLSIPIIMEQVELRSLLIKKNSLENIIFRMDNLITERFAYKFCNHLFVISNYLFSHYSEKFPKDRLSLIPIFVDMERFKVKPYYKSFRIGYLGSFAPKDEVSGIVRAFSRAIKKLPGLKLRLIGNIKDYQIKELKNIALVNNVDENLIEFTGRVLDEEIPRLLAECDLLVINRNRLKYSYFGFPNKLGEYLATGIPVIATKIGDIEKYLTDGKDAILIEPEDELELAEKILIRYMEYDKYTNIGRMGKETCKKYFDYKKIMKEVDIIIKRLIEDKK